MNKLDKVFHLKTLLLFVFLSLYLASFSVSGRILTLSMGAIGLYLLIVKPRQFFSLLNTREILIVSFIILPQALSLLGPRTYGEACSISDLLIFIPFNIIMLYFLLMNGTNNGIYRAISLIRIIAVFLIISSVFFLGYLAFPSEFSHFRYFLYEASIHTQMEWGVNPLTSTGLSPAHYLFGYQLAAGIVLSISLFLIEKGYWQILWGLGSILVIEAAIASGERTVIISTITGFVVFYLLSPPKKIKIQHLSVLFIAISIIIGLVWFSIYKSIGEDDIIKATKIFDISDKKTIFQRLFYPKHLSMSKRLKMQLASVEIILENPLGLFVQGKRPEDWGELAEKKGCRVLLDSTGYYQLIHNGYLGRILYFGWLMGVLIVYVLVFIFREMRYFRSKSIHESLEMRYGRVIAATLFALLIYPMFHNPSLFSIEKTTWLIFIMFLIWGRLVKKDRISVASG